MRVAVSWLRQFVRWQVDARRLAHRLTMAGLEVEAVEVKKPVGEGVLAARVKQVQPHPGADRLKVCVLAIGSGKTVTVVCGAPDVVVGQLVAYAGPGCELPGGIRVAEAEIRGVKSVGMLCSEAELGLGDERLRLMLLPLSARAGSRLGVVLGLDDWVLEVSITPNRGDCLSVIGLAREVAALTGGKLGVGVVAVAEGESVARKQVKVEIKARERCRRYAARVVHGVSVGESPFWLRHRLELAGVRPINNVVDVTNFVMLERGQPLHAFDLAKLAGQRIVVRQAQGWRKFSTLDGVERELEATDLLICDSRGPVALAGIMGGANSQIGDGSKGVLLESAFFSPPGIRSTARRLGLNTESSYRFERGVDPEGVLEALDRAAGLLQEVAGGQVCRGIVEARGRAVRARSIRMRPERVSRLLGTEIPKAEVRRRLLSIGAGVKRGPRDTLVVVPPSYRFDLGDEVDLAEEIARLRGYERIPTRLPRGGFAPGVEELGVTGERRIRELLLGQGLTEMIVPPFVSARENEAFPSWVLDQGAPVRLLNPLSQEEGELRESLIPGLLRAVRYNLNHGEQGVCAFSLGRVYRQHKDQSCQEKRLVGGVLYGDKPVRGLGVRRAKSDFSEAKGVLENVFDGLRLTGVSWKATAAVKFLHPGQAVEVRLDSAVCAILGALHPQLQQCLGLPSEAWVFELDLRHVVDYAPPRLRFQSLPRFPAIRRDVSLVVPEALPAGEIAQAIDALKNPLIVEVSLFDQYVGAPIEEGHRSLSYRIAYRAVDRTLTDEEVNELHGRVTGHIVERFSVSVRS